MKFVRTLSLLALLVTMCTPLARAEDAAMKKPEMKMDKMAGGIPMMLEANERKVQDSFKTKDMTTFNSLVAADAWMIDPTGINPVTMVPDMMKMMEVKSFTMDNFKTKMIDKDAYITYYTSTSDAMMNGQPYPAGPWFCSTVWAKSGKDWKAVFHTETMAMQQPTPAPTSETGTH